MLKIGKYEYPDNVQISIRTNPTQKRQLKVMCADRGRSINEFLVSIIQREIDEYLEEKKGAAEA